MSDRSLTSVPILITSNRTGQRALDRPTQSILMQRAGSTFPQTDHIAHTDHQLAHTVSLWESHIRSAL